jgi:DNA helicase II / ATP-dependent DNA helicase PcrA
MTRPSTPSPYQEAIFRFALEGSGHGVIMATAGSGKSTTLVEVAHRLPVGTRACFLAFNTSAAQQLKDRLPAHVTARTVHALGLKTLAASVKGRKLARVYPRKYQELVKARLRNTEESYRVSSQTASQAVHYLRELTHYARVNLAQEADRGVLERLTRTYHMRPPEQPELVSNLHTLLWEILRDGVTLALEGLYDYTDMIYAPLAADLSPTRRFDLVCVDEAQDLSPMQLSFILRLPCPNGRLLFVGDPKQAIYGFAGADTKAMSRIVERTQATVLPLSVNYRCPQKHVRLARRFAPAIQAAPDAVEGRVTAIPEGALSRYVTPGDLVLCRINAPLVETCLELIQKRIPAQVLGRDIAGKLVVDAKLVFKQGLEDWRGKLNRFEAREVEGIKQAKLPQDVTERMVYRREDELACLRAVVEDAVRGGMTTLKGLEARIDSLFGDARGMVTLSTVHRAKGKEAENVFILLPYLMPLPNATTPEELEAEDCVRFVAVTRARQKLVFVEPGGACVPCAWWREGGVGDTTKAVAVGVV